MLHDLPSWMPWIRDAVGPKRKAVLCRMEGRPNPVALPCLKISTLYWMSIGIFQQEEKLQKTIFS